MALIQATNGYFLSVLHVTIRIQSFHSKTALHDRVTARSSDCFSLASVAEGATKDQRALAPSRPAPFLVRRSGASGLVLHRRPPTSSLLDFHNVSSRASRICTTSSLEIQDHRHTTASPLRFAHVHRFSRADANCLEGRIGAHAHLRTPVTGQDTVTMEPEGKAPDTVSAHPASSSSTARRRATIRIVANTFSTAPLPRQPPAQWYASLSSYDMAFLLLPRVGTLAPDRTRWRCMPRKFGRGRGHGLDHGQGRPPSL